MKKFFQNFVLILLLLFICFLFFLGLFAREIPEVKDLDSYKIQVFSQMEILMFQGILCDRGELENVSCKGYDSDKEKFKKQLKIFTINIGSSCPEEVSDNLAPDLFDFYRFISLNQLERAEKGLRYSSERVIQSLENVRNEIYSFEFNKVCFKTE